jgi:maltooligosyltrehalose trehalohydrolase
MSEARGRRLPIGAEVQPDGATHFRVWAPRPRRLELIIERCRGEGIEVELDAEGDGYYSALVRDVGYGDRYRYRLDGESVPDVASRYQPNGPFGPSMVVDPRRFRWTDSEWRGVTLAGQVLCEMHVGTFTRLGTWRSAIDRLRLLARTGITVVEVMPVAEFPGQFGWGYDGVYPYAPTRLYGTPDDFRAFVDAAHGLGLGVILDVVYNHLGPDGCVFSTYSDAYFTKKYDNEWGDALNFDGVESAAVREYFVSNAGYWIDEFHLDGLRLDATQSIHDASAEHIVAAVGRRARECAGDRQIIVVAENEPQLVRMVRPLTEDGYGLDALWNDDFHHSACVALTGRNEAYYSDHQGRPQELISAVKYGYLFQGQRYAWQKQKRGTRSDGVPPSGFVTFVENHDQLANSGDGSRVRVRTTPGRYRAMATLLLLMPSTPMLFQGQEFGASAPFLYFADHKPEIAAAVQKGRGEFVSQFPSLATREMQCRLAAPHAVETFERCKLDWTEYEAHDTCRRLHTDLIALRRTDAAFRAQQAGAVDGAVLAEEAFVLRFTTPRAEDERLLIVNLGRELVAASFPEPLVAPPDGYDWAVRWSSEDADYGGFGTADVANVDGWRIPGHSAIVLRPELSHGSRGTGSQ